MFWEKVGSVVVTMGKKIGKSRVKLYSERGDLEENRHVVLHAKSRREIFAWKQPSTQWLNVSRVGPFLAGIEHLEPLHSLMEPGNFIRNSCVEVWCQVSLFQDYAFDFQKKSFERKCVTFQYSILHGFHMDMHNHIFLHFMHSILLFAYVWMYLFVDVSY